MDDREENTNPQSAPREPLFQVSDVPTFASASEYEYFRSSLLGFFRSEFDPAPMKTGVLWIESYYHLKIQSPEA